MKYLIPFFAAGALVMAQPAQPKQSIPLVSAEMLGKCAAPTRTAKSEAASATAVTTSNMVYEALVTYDASITVQPGTWWVSPESRLDFSGADHAAIALHSPYVDLTGLHIVPAWASPGMYFNFTDIETNFTLLDHTSMFTPVYGPHLKVGLYNGSSAPLEIKQLTVYAARKNAQ
jgi:hypothetical protein